MRSSRQLQEARPAPQQEKDHHLPHSNLDGFAPARSWPAPPPTDLSGTRAVKRARGAAPLRGGPMSAAPEKTLENGARLPPQSCMPPRSRGAQGRTGLRGRLEAFLFSGKRLSSGKEKKKAGQGVGGEGGRGPTTRGRTAGCRRGMGFAERGAGYSRSRKQGKARTPAGRGGPGLRVARTLTGFPLQRKVVTRQNVPERVRTAPVQQPAGLPG